MFLALGYYNQPEDLQLESKVAQLGLACPCLECVKKRLNRRRCSQLEKSSDFRDWLNKDLKNPDVTMSSREREGGDADAEQHYQKDRHKEGCC